MNTTGVCAALKDRDGLEKYIDDIRSTARGWNDTVAICRKEVCGSLLGGRGNPDISGIGVIIGYFVQNAIGFILSIIIFAWFLKISSPGPWLRKRTRHFICLKGALEAYQSSAIFFSSSIQLVTVIFHVRKDFGGGNRSLAVPSGHEIEIGWSVSLLIFIPLFYPLSLPEGFLKRHGLNISFIFLCGLLHIYILCSRIYAFSSPRISGSIVTEQEWDFLDSTCHMSGKKLSDHERKISAILFFIGSPILLLVLFYKLMHAAVIAKTTGTITTQDFSHQKPYQKKARGIFYFIILPAISFTQIWSILRLRIEQKSMAKSIGLDFPDNSWSFGQIIALLIWTPVIVEYLYLLLSDEGSKISYEYDKLTGNIMRLKGHREEPQTEGIELWDSV